MKDYTNIIDALKEAGHKVNDSTFSKKMEDPNFVESVRIALKDEGHVVPDSTVFHEKYVNKVEIPKIEQPIQEPSYLDQVSKSIYPRLSEDASIKNLALDLASLPGRTIASGLLGGLAAVGGEKIPEALQSGFQDVKPESGLGGLVRDIITNPFNIVPGIGEIGGVGKSLLGKAVPKLAEGVGSILSNSPKLKALGTVAGEGGLNVGLGQIASDDSNKTKDFLLGATIGGIPSAGFGLLKSKNLRSLGEDILSQTKNKNVNPLFVSDVLVNDAKDLNSYLKSQGLSKNLPKDSKGIMKQYFEKDIPEFMKHSENVTRPEVVINPFKEDADIIEKNIMDIEKKHPGFAKTYDNIVGGSSLLQKAKINEKPVNTAFDLPNITQELASTYATGMPGLLTTGKLIKNYPHVIESVVENNPNLKTLITPAWRGFYRPTDTKK